MIYGYSRVSTKGQAKDGNSLEAQERVLKEAGASIVFPESYTGTKKDRPKLDELMAVLKPGDMVVVTKLDRIARNVKDGIDIIDTILENGCSIRIMNMGMFDNTPTGRLTRNVMLAFAEFERDMIVQRTSEGKAIAREKEGYTEGRPKKKADILEYIERQKNGELTVKECCAKLGIKRSTWYNRVKEIA